MDMTLRSGCTTWEKDRRLVWEAVRDDKADQLSNALVGKTAEWVAALYDVTQTSVATWAWAKGICFTEFTDFPQLETHSDSRIGLQLTSLLGAAAVVGHINVPLQNYPQGGTAILEGHIT